MSNLLSNLYWNPGAFGAKVLCDIDDADSYEFNMVVVWMTPSIDLYYGWDSG